MKINDLSKEFGVTNKELIDLLKANGYPAKSHLQTVEPEWEEYVRNNLVVKEVVSEENKSVVNKEPTASRPKKTYSPDELIPCRSITPWRVIDTGVDKNSGVIYNWSGFGDIEYVTYRDLQYLKRRDIIKNGMIVIEDEDLCMEWSRELGEYNKNLIGIEYPEELFELNDSEFESLLTNSSETYKEVVKYTAMNMIHNGNYPTVQKITIIDNVLGTCIKEFL